LDLLIIQDNNNLSFKMHRKPTARNQLLHAFSIHPNFIKQNVIYNTFLRSLNISDPRYLEEEIRFVFQQFQSLGYTIAFINKQLIRARLHILRGRTGEAYVKPINTVVIPYCEAIATLKFTISTICGVHIIFSFPDKITNYLIHNNNTVDERQGGVYSVPCSTCASSYYGETLKSLQFRIDQHKADVKRCNVSNAIFIHITTQHRINWEDAKFVFNSKSKPLNRLIESFFIKTLPNFNISTGFFEVDNILIKFLRNIFKTKNTLNCR